MPEEYRERSRALKLRTLSLISANLIILVLAGYFGLKIYSADLKSKNQDLTEQILLLESQTPSEVQLKTLSLQNQLQSIVLLLDQHLYWSEMLGHIEELTLPEVKFRSFTGNTSQITLKAIAPSYTILARQIKSFETMEEKFIEVDFSNASLDEEDKIGFNLILTLSKDALLKERGE